VERASSIRKPEMVSVRVDLRPVAEVAVAAAHPPEDDPAEWGELLLAHYPGEQTCVARSDGRRERGDRLGSFAHRELAEWAGERTRHSNAEVPHRFRAKLSGMLGHEGRGLR
jgi:hypothetical protein